MNQLQSKAKDACRLANGLRPSSADYGISDSSLSFETHEVWHLVTSDTEFLYLSMSRSAEEFVNND
jgi:hypothetical protein